jgi:glycosyltransferase involved in cell wall biosynthesis
MTKEKILLVGDSLLGPTGFATDLAGVCWSLAKDYEVHALGLQSFREEKIGLNIQGEIRDVIQHPNQPRTNQRFDFGTRSLPVLLDNLEPDILITVNDIQMINHVPMTICPPAINLKVIDLPSKKFMTDYELNQLLKGEIQKFREKFPRDMKWIAYCPQDGDPPMGVWRNVYDMADQCVAMANYGQWVFKQFFKMDVPVIYHGVDTNIFNNQKKPDNLKDKFVLGNFNRNQPRKQPVRCMEAFAKFARGKSDVLLHMQMDWRDEFGWPLDYFAQIFGIQHQMMQPLQAGMQREMVPGVYNSWDVNLMPTAGEGFGLCTTEGAACGLPTIHTDYTTGKELLIDGQPSPRGVLVQAKDLIWEKMDVAAVRRSLIDIDKMADAMEFYYKNRQACIDHGKNAEQWIKNNCTWTHISKHWLELVDNVLEGDEP